MPGGTVVVVLGGTVVVVVGGTVVVVVGVVVGGDPESPAARGVRSDPLTWSAEADPP